ncbi:family 20 glycosylhydrolase, partial [Staphylococcus haemolyticus]|nr:family 20 glycosylhydrolase [Staphylococcus haemolyticus]
IDIARKYYSKDSLKKIVQQISEYNGSYLQLHFSDNENYTINSNYLDQTANKKNKYFLTKSELEELIKFANKKNIQVIPDIDLPSHSKGWLTLLRKKDEDLYRNVVSNYSNEMVDYHNNKASILVSRKLIKEILVMFEQPKFKNEQKIVLGGDEVPGSIRQQDDFINFMNEITKVALEGNYTVKLWNDSITTNGLKTLNNNIIIMFWQRKSSDLSSVDDFLKQDYSIEN